MLVSGLQSIFWFFIEIRVVVVVEEEEAEEVVVV